MNDKTSDQIAALIIKRNELCKKFEQTGNSRYLSNAIEVGEMALDAMASDHPNRGDPLSNLGTLLYHRFKRTRALEDLSRSIQLSELAVAVTADDHVDRGAWLTNLANRLRARFDQNQQKEDIDRAITMARQSVAITLPESQNLAGRLSNLGIQFLSRFQVLGEMTDLDSAIEVSRKAVDASPPNHPRHSVCLINLSSQLGTRFEHTSLIEDLDQACDAAELALEAVSESSQEHADALTNTANWVGMRFSRTGESEDLESAINYSQMAVKALPPGHPNRGPWLDNAGTWVTKRFERTGNKDDINLGVHYSTMALEATAPGRPERSAALVNLASRLAVRFQKYRQIDDIDRAIGFAESVIRISSPNLSNRLSYSSNLGTFLALRYEEKKDLHDLNRAIQLTEETTKQASPDHPNRAKWLGNLASHLEARFDLTQSWSDRELAIIALKEGWSCQRAPAATRITLARRASVLLSSQKEPNWAVSSELLEGAVDLLATVSPRSLHHFDKQYVLSKFAGLASLAAATALNAEKGSLRALELLELGRGVIAGLSLEMRTDISALRQQHPELAEEFVTLAGRLDISVNERPLSFSLSVNETGTSASPESLAKKRRQAEEQLQEVLDEIRSRDGFESFLLPPTEKELGSAATPGPIVVINATSYRCDALIVRKDQPVQFLELPNLRFQDVEQNSACFRGGLPSDLRRILDWLWDVAACPILDFLGFTQPPIDDNWPHVWWIPTGKLSQLPFHAAGRHFESSNNTVLDRVISSYSSSIKSLIYGRQTPNVEPSGAPGKAVLVTVPGSGLPYAKEEVSRLKELCSSTSLRLNPVTPAPERSEILKHLRNCKIFHFAGHGQSHPSQPSNSRLLLGENHSLTVAHLRDCKLQDNSPFLAYLSACSTRVHAAETLVDEDIHLVSACQLAGFRHVVGTLWEVYDRHCVGIAQDFYSTIRDEGMVDKAVYQGLHRAIRRLRDARITTAGDRDMGHSIEVARGKPKYGGGEAQGTDDDDESLMKGLADDHKDNEGETEGKDPESNGFGYRQTTWTVSGYSRPATVQAQQDDPLVWAAYIHMGV